MINQCVLDQLLHKVYSIPCLRQKFDTRVNMYNALVMPYFNYYGAVWGNINKGLAVKLQKLQNRAARILTFSNYDVRSSVLLDELGGKG